MTSLETMVRYAIFINKLLLVSYHLIHRDIPVYALDALSCWILLDTIQESAMWFNGSIEVACSHLRLASLQTHDL